MLSKKSETIPYLTAALGEDRNIFCERRNYLLSVPGDNASCRDLCAADLCGFAFASKRSKMAREKIEIKKIEKRAARHVTFSKRRRGLIKKAQELSILCEADVGLVIFSTTGKLFQYCSSSMKMILEKYQKYSNITINSEQLSHEVIQLENQEVIRMRQEIEDLNHMLRQMHGKDLEGLTMTELHQLETKLKMGLRQICSKKDECLLKEIFELQKQLNEMQSCHVKSNNAEEHLFIEPLFNDHPQSSESTICNAYNSKLHKASNDASDTPLRLGLSI